MEKINSFLEEDQKIELLKNERIVWKKLKTKSKLLSKKEKLDRFFILTDKRWIQKIDIYNDTYVFLITVLDIHDYILYIDLEDIEFIFMQKADKGKEYIGFILNRYIEQRNEEYLLIAGVDLEPEEYDKFLSILKGQMRFGLVEEKEGWNGYSLHKRER
ncbi:MAG: hypothetical protein ACOC44_09795 [Promethearchaeia archaeon]